MLRYIRSLIGGNTRAHDEAADNQPQDPLKISSNLPNLYSFEKLIITIDYLQLYGLLWNLSNCYPWPYIWLQWTRGICYANFDFFSLTTNGALVGRSASIGLSRWGYMTGYLNYSLIFAIIALSLPIIGAISYRLTHQYGKAYESIHDAVYSILLIISYIIYLPVGLAVCRLYYCEYDAQHQIHVLVSFSTDSLCISLTSSPRELIMAYYVIVQAIIFILLFAA